MIRVLGVLVLLAASQARALPPDQLNYQGRMVNLTGSAAVPDSLTNSATFRIYNAPSGGTLMWAETQANVATKGGLFNVVLGSVVPMSAVPFDAPYWLEVVWDKLGVPEVMSPRQPLTASPYAFRAKFLSAPSSLTGSTAATSLSVFNNLLGTGGNALLGLSNGDATAGVIGRNDAAANTALGVYGEAQTGKGVLAQSNTGTGLFASSASGTGIEAQGSAFGLSVTATGGGGSAGLFAGTSNNDMVRVNQNGTGAGVVSVSQGGFGIDGYSYGTGTTYGVRGLLAGNGASGAGILGWAYGTGNTGAGVKGENDSQTGIGVQALNAQASSAGTPAVALDIDGGIQVKARGDAPAGIQNVATPNLVGAVNPFRFGNGNIVNNQIQPNSVILLTAQCPSCPNNMVISTKLTTIVTGQANYSIIAENSNGTDPGTQNCFVHYLIINQR